MTIRASSLPNGLRVISDSMESVESVSLGIWVEAGTRHEDPEINGVSHILEHMAFKGTARRSAKAIAEEIEAVGGHINAYTSRENTAYFAKVLKDDLGLAVDIIADILQNPAMDAEELDRELNVIVQEIHQAHDTPDDVVFDHFQKAAFPGQALGRPVLGTADLVRDMGRDTIIEYMRGHYSAPSMVLSAAGRVDHQHLVELAASAFQSLPPRREFSPKAARYAGGDVREARPLEQVHLLIGFEGVAYEDPGFYPLSVFSTLFGGGMSSRLFQEVRENRGLAYSIYSFLSCYADSGLFGIYAGTGEDEVAETLPLICAEIRKVCAEVREQEVARARVQIKAGILMSLESTSSRCEQLARQMIVFKRPLPIDEIIAKIDAVDPPAVLAAARRLFSGKPALAALGPLSKVESLEEVAARLG